MTEDYQKSQQARQIVGMVCYLINEVGVYNIIIRIFDKLGMQILLNSRLFETLEPQKLTILQKLPVLCRCLFLVETEGDGGTNSHTGVSSSESSLRLVQLQIRRDYIVEVQEDKGILLSAFDCNLKNKFQILRAQPEDLIEPGNEWGLRLIFGENEDEVLLESLENGQNTTLFHEFLKELKNKELMELGFNLLYKPVRRIGRGSSACVFEGENKFSEQRVAIRSFRKKKLFENQSGWSNFEEEVSILRNLNNPYTSRLFALYETQNSIYMILELLPRNLLTHLLKFGFPPLQLCIAILFKLALGLRYLHRQGIIHRDLKLENIMVRGEGNHVDPVIIDFGLARHDIGTLNSRCGTSGYIAPEVIVCRSTEQSQPYDRKCDIFSLGAIYYIMLLGRPLFQAEDAKHLYALNLQCDIDLSFPRDPSMPPDMKDLLAGMLEKDPIKRISAEEIVNHEFFKNLRKDPEFSGLAGVEN